MEFLKRSTSGRASRRPRLMLGDQALPVLEPRVVPTVIAGPYINNQYGTVTTFNESNTFGTMSATVTNNSNQLVRITFQSFSNATAGSTSAGDHNSGAQQRNFPTQTLFLPPNASLPFLPVLEDRAGRASDGQITASQFDVQVTPVNLFNNPTAPTVNTGGIIAYRGPAPAGAAPASLDFASAPIIAGLPTDVSNDSTGMALVTTAVNSDD